MRETDWSWIWWMAYTALHASEGAFGEITVADLMDANEDYTEDECGMAHCLYLAACL